MKHDNNHKENKTNIEKDEVCVQDYDTPSTRLIWGELVTSSLWVGGCRLAEGGSAVQGCLSTTPRR